MTAPELPALADRTRVFAAGAAVVGAFCLGDTVMFVLGEAELLAVNGSAEPQRIAVHAGGILTAVSDGKRIITGGDDGKVMVTRPDLSPAVASVDAKRRWIDHVAAGPDGAIAWSAGKDAVVLPGKGEERRFTAPSTVGGLAFAPKGLRLAVAHYHGATLWFPNATEAKPERLEWMGSHLDVTFSPDGKYLVTAMQEPTLHGWRITDAKHMRMSGYAAKVRSMSWTAEGKALATSGANEVILWPFHGKDGPMGKEPRILAPTRERVSQVACHPEKDVVAAGYEDGLVLLVRISDGAEILGRRPGGGAISALAWSPKGGALAYGTEDGEAGIVNLG